MRIQVKGRGGASADDELLARVEKKLGKVARQVSPLAELTVELREERNPGINESQVAEGALKLKGVTLRTSTATSAGAVARRRRQPPRSTRRRGA